MKRPNLQHSSAFTLRYHHATDPHMVTVGAATFPRTGMADVLMYAEELITSGYAVTITPPPMTVRPVSVHEVVDLEVLAP